MLGLKWDLVQIDDSLDNVVKYMRVHQQEDYLFSTVRITVMMLEGIFRQDASYREHLLHNSSISKEVYT